MSRPYAPEPAYYPEGYEQSYEAYDPYAAPAQAEADAYYEPYAYPEADTYDAYGPAGYYPDSYDYEPDSPALFRPALFYPLAVFIGLCLGGLVIASGLLPARGNGPASTTASRNATRTTGLQSLATALKKYETDRHVLPSKLPPTLTEICISTREPCSQSGLVDLMYLVSAGYLEALPNDPIGGHTEYGSGFLIARSADGTLYLKAMRAEDGKDIELVQ